MKSLRSEKGAITLITLITILFLISFLITSYVLVSNKVKTQKEILSETKKIYEPKTSMEEIYNSYFTNDDIIPIYTVEQLLAIGNNETININGKVYTFSNTENTAYLLKNDLEFSATDLNLEDDWIPPYQNEDLLANFDWSGHTIKVTKLNGNTITYDGTYLATVTGNSLILKNSIKGNLLDYKIYGNSVQNGTPSPDAPVEIQSVGDKTNNLLDMSIYKNSVSQNGITVTYLEEEDVIVLNGTAEKTADVAATYINIPITNGSYFSLSTKYISGKISRPNESDYAVVFFGAQDNIDSSTNWKNVKLSEEDSKLENAKCDYNYITRIFLYISTGVTFDNYKVKIQLEQGSKATEYEQYGKYKIPIKVTGKNKYFNSSNRDANSSYGVNIKNQIGNSDFTITGTANTTGNLLGAVGNILKPGNYKIKLEGDNKLDSYYLQVSTDNSTWTNKLLQLQPNNVYSFTITELSYVRIGIKIVKDEQYDSNYKVLIRDADINVSDSYEPYREETYNIYLDEPLRKAGAYADYIDFETGNVVRQVKERQVTSSTTFYTYAYASSNFYGFAFTDSKMPKGTRWDGFCSYLPNKTKVWFSVNNTRIYISLNDIYNSAETDSERIVKLKEWLDSLETPFIVQFPATLDPEPIELPDISILKGRNFIEVDTQVQPSNISVTYNAKQ